MIRVERLTKRIDGQAVLDDVSVELARGQVTALVGPSGGGKSTLLRCINGLEPFDAGRVEAFGAVIGPRASRTVPGFGREARAARHALHEIRRRVGMVFQGYGLFQHMTALGNVMEGPRHVMRLPEAEARASAEALLERVGLTRRMHAFPRELSGGEQQRVAIARALAMRPEALLLDEPTSALDLERKAEVVALLAGLKAEGATMIIVTHEPLVIRDLIDRTIVVREGRLVTG